MFCMDTCMDLYDMIYHIYLIGCVPSRKLTYPPKMAFWRWFPFPYVNSLEGNDPKFWRTFILSTRWMKPVRQARRPNPSSSDRRRLDYIHRLVALEVHIFFEAPSWIWTWYHPIISNYALPLPPPQKNKDSISLPKRKVHGRSLEP